MSQAASQLGDTTTDGPRKRVVSLVPSLTELVFWLGRGEWLMGRTRFCDEPRGIVEQVPAVGGTKDPNLERIDALQPDLVLANREENRREDVEALIGRGIDVLLTDPDTVPAAVAMVREVGRALDAEAAAEELAQEIEVLLAEPTPTSRTRVFVPVWKQPLMALGGATYGNDLLERCGATNVFADRPRYPEVALDEVGQLQPDLILLPDEPYRFKERDTAAFAGIAPARVIDGRLLWWYGPRMPDSIRTLRGLLSG